MTFGGDRRRTGMRCTTRGVSGTCDRRINRVVRTAQRWRCIRCSPGGGARPPFRGRHDQRRRVGLAGRGRALGAVGRKLAAVGVHRDPPRRTRSRPARRAPGPQQRGVGSTAGALVANLSHVLVEDTDWEYSEFSLYDPGQAVAHMTFQAQSLGLHVRQFRASDRAALTREFGIPPHWQVSTMSAIGRGGPGRGPTARRRTGAVAPGPAAPAPGGPGTRRGSDPGRSRCRTPATHHATTRWRRARRSPTGRRCHRAEARPRTRGPRGGSDRSGP